MAFQHSKLVRSTPLSSSGGCVTTATISILPTVQQHALFHKSTALAYTNRIDPPFDSFSSSSSSSSGVTSTVNTIHNVTASPQPQQRSNVATTDATTNSRARRNNDPRTVVAITTLDDFHGIVQECQENNQILIVYWSASWCRSCQRIQPLLHRLVQQQQQQQQQQLNHPNTGIATATSTTPVRNDNVRGCHRPTAVRYVNIPIHYSLSKPPLPSSSSSSPPQHKYSHAPSPNLHAMFGIHTVPYCHIYHPNFGLVEECQLTSVSKRNNHHPNNTIGNFSSPKVGSSSRTKQPPITIQELASMVQSYQNGYCSLNQLEQ
jgi:thiol-disulfide isomerase/thioredoxin